jgi:uncharacterized protein YndB with AHSA1/START domain
MDRTDRIERSVTVDASPERVWEAITNADEVKQWFGDIIEIDLRPGGKARFGWTEYSNVIGGVVEIVEPPTRFVYRWGPGVGESAEEGPSTRVEFTLAPSGGGTEITVVETGFAALPESFYESALTQSTSGWKAELKDLVEFLAGAGEA